jgi:hypothetical protein
MTPTKIVLEIADTAPTLRKYAAKSYQLRVFAPETQKGSLVIGSTPIASGKSLLSFRKHGLAYAKRFSIPFVDQTISA